MPTDRRSIHSNVGGSSDLNTQCGRISNQWLADEVYPTIGTSRSNSRSQSRTRKASSLDSNRSGTRSPRASLEDSNTTMRARNMPAESIAFAEDYKTSNEKRERSKSRSRMSSESSTPRSRSRSTYDTHRLSTDENLWKNDKERKHGKFIEKVLSHKLSPSFLK